MNRIAWAWIAWASAFAAPALAQTPGEKDFGRWAILIGVDEYLHVEPLKFCGADMRALRDQLIDSGFPAKQVFLLDDKAEKNKYKPFKSNIERELDQVLGMVEQDDLVVVAFSGHGVLLDGQSYLCPEDGSLEDLKSLVPLEGVYVRLQKCRAALRVFLVDACRNDPRVTGRRSMASNPGGGAFGTALEKPPEGILLLSSCSPGQIAMEEKDFGHGVFMHYLLKGLQGGADSDADGFVSLMELYRYANKETKLYVHEKFHEHQTPALKGELHDDFNLARLGRKSQTNSVGMTLALIPAGEFQMGNAISPDAEVELFRRQDISLDADALAAEYPAHRVRLSKPFWMSVRETTVGQFRRFVEESGYKTEAERSGQGAFGYDSKAGTFAQRRDFSWRNPGFPQADDHPVVCVSWNDADAFAKWLSKKEGCVYRLPTEAEWEYACRAGSASRYSGADEPGQLAAIANVTFKSSENETPRFTMPVGRFRPNGFGLFDMHGNAAEWCGDWFAADYYRTSPGTDPTGPERGQTRAARGGSWFSWPNLARSAFRIGIPPSTAPATLGFRLVRDP